MVTPVLQGAKRGRPLMTPGKKKKAVDSYSYNLHMLGEVASKQSCVDPQPSMGLISIEPTDIMNRSMYSSHTFKLDATEQYCCQFPTCQGLAL